MVARAIIVALAGWGNYTVYTTNPEVTTGDGIAAATSRAELMDMEFVRHPRLNIAGAPTFLISEAACWSCPKF